MFLAGCVLGILRLKTTKKLDNMKDILFKNILYQRKGKDCTTYTNIFTEPERNKKKLSNFLEVKELKMNRRMLESRKFRQQSKKQSLNTAKQKSLKPGLLANKDMTLYKI